MAAIATATFAASTIASVAPAEAKLVVSGSDWLGGQGVDVCAPESDPCIDNGTTITTTTYDTNGNSLGFQCVDLPQRLYKKMGWYPNTTFPVLYAYQIWGDNGAGATALGFTPEPNGYVPVPGDMIVESPYAGNDWDGHVAVVDHVSGDTIYALEENAPGFPSGMGAGYHLYTINPDGSIGGAYSTNGVLGIVHAPADTLPYTTFPFTTENHQLTDAYQDPPQNPRAHRLPR